MPNRMMRTCSLAFLVTLVLLTCFAVSANQRNKKPRTAAELYARNCASCHGTGGRAKTTKGKFSHARDLTDAKWHDDVTDERIFNSIMNGRNVRGNMPAFSDKLNEKEVDSLVSFVRKFKG
jgi:mono/diheme cytochrome c family protein